MNCAHSVDSGYVLGGELLVRLHMNERLRYLRHFLEHCVLNQVSEAVSFAD